MLAARLETGSYVLIFVLSRVCEENDVEIQWLQSKKKFSYNREVLQTEPVRFSERSASGF